jgi:hypothetical protein
VLLRAISHAMSGRAVGASSVAPSRAPAGAGSVDSS